MIIIIDVHHPDIISLLKMLQSLEKNILARLKPLREGEEIVWSVRSAISQDYYKNNLENFSRMKLEAEVSICRQHNVITMSGDCEGKHATSRVVISSADFSMRSCKGKWIYEDCHGTDKGQSNDELAEKMVAVLEDWRERWLKQMTEEE